MSADQLLKTQLIKACQDIFPEAKTLLLWGGATTTEFHNLGRDVDVILEIDAEFSSEIQLAVRLKSLVAHCTFCTLDPFLYLTGAVEREELEFIAPFGFYKANPFIPYMIQEQHEVLLGMSKLLPTIKRSSLNEALLEMMPLTLGALKRIKMDTRVEGAWAPVIAKHRTSFALVARTYFALDQERIGSKREAILHLAKKLPAYDLIAQELWKSLNSNEKPSEEAKLPDTELMLDFVNEMESIFQAAKKRLIPH